MEGRLSKEKLENFRRELKTGRRTVFLSASVVDAGLLGISDSFDGLEPADGDLSARFQRYLENRGMKPATDAKVWAFLGDGETDEPESLGAITLASREKLDNLIFVVNCNLQRLDGPVRATGNYSGIGIGVRGARWNVIKVLWGSEWIRFWSATRRDCSSSGWDNSWTASIRSWWFRRARMFANIFLDMTRGC